MTAIEMQDLSQKKAKAASNLKEFSGPDLTATDENDQSVALWAYGATILYAFLSFFTNARP